MARTVVALYDEFLEAERTVRDLVDAGFARENISLIANDNKNAYARYLSESSSDPRDGEDAVKAGEGAGFGAVVGALTGVLVGLGAFAIPGIGPVIAAGPLIAGLTGGTVGAVAGAATGGLVAGLVKTGVTEDDAAQYVEGIRQGGTLVIVHTSDSMAADARDIMNQHDPVDIGDRQADLGLHRSTFEEHETDLTDDTPSDLDRPTPLVTGQTTYDTSGISASNTTGGMAASSSDAASSAADFERSGAALSGGGAAAASRNNTGMGTMGVSAEMSGMAGSGSAMASLSNAMTDTNSGGGFDTFDGAFRSHFESNYASKGLTYDHYSPMYRYGVDLANDQRYLNKDWDLVKLEARRRWEERNPNYPWAMVEDAVRHGWERARGRF